MSPFEVVGFGLYALGAHRLRTALSLVGMAIGVAAVVVLTALGEGARRYVIDQFASIGSNLLVVVPGRTETTGLAGVGGVPNDLTLEDVEALLRQIPGIARVAPLSMGTETVSRRERRRDVAIVGTTAEFLPIRRLSVSSGQFLPPEELSRGAAVTVIGQKVVHELFPGGEPPLGKVVRIGGWRMKVIGVLSSRGTQLGLDLDEVAMVPVRTGMRMFDRRTLFRVLVEPRPNVALDDLEASLLSVLVERHGEEDVTIVTQDAVMSSFDQILGVLTLALAAIAAVSLAVAGLGIMNVMLVSVSERTAEVGLLKALGGHRRQILSIFLAEAALLSLAGATVGLSLGWAGVALLVEIFPALPAAPPLWAVVAALSVALGVGTLFGVLPARRASRLDPVAALAGRG